jgi:5'-AMP-activated protein kinase catalytic alpha subunit
LDPNHRITIPEIRQCEWFQTELPDYLQSNDFSNGFFQEVDRDVIEQVKKIFKLSSSRAVEAIVAASGDRLDPRDEQIAVVYQILADQKEKEMHRPAGPNDSKPRRLVSASVTPTSPLSVLSSGSLPAFSLGRVPASPALSTTPAMSMREGKRLTEVLQETEAVSKSYDKSDMIEMDVASSMQVWTLGIVSKLPPKDIICEVLNTLKMLNFEWKVISPYRFRCRKFVEVGGVAKQVKMSVQLYQLTRDTFILDFQKHEGEIFLFFEISAQLLKLYSRKFHIPSIATSAPRSSSSLVSNIWQLVARR